MGCDTPPCAQHGVDLIAAHEVAGTGVAYRQQAHPSCSQIHEPASMGVGHPLVDRGVVEIEAISRFSLSPSYRRRW
jgi:hypothetical protein